VEFTQIKYLAISLCIFVGCDKKEYMRKTPIEFNAPNSSRDYEIKNYRKMFGSIKVPKWPELNEPEAPSPIIYLIVNEGNDDVIIRKPIADLTSWEYEEIETTKARELSRSTNTPVSFVVVADREVPINRFIPLIKKIKNELGIQNVWLQVWGVHPYPLQIPINVDLIDSDAIGNNINNLQKYVDWHSAHVGK
jgi:hypothetical protein